MSLGLRSGYAARISARVIPSATIPTTVATGMRKRRMHGTPSIWRGSTVMRLNFIDRSLLSRRRNGERPSRKSPSSDDCDDSNQLPQREAFVARGCYLFDFFAVG